MNTAEIKIWGQLVGAVSWDDYMETGIFEFEPSFIKNEWDLAPLIMPLDAIKRGEREFEFMGLNKDTFYGLPGLLSDALPDKYGTTLMDAWLASQGRAAGSMNPVERLCYIGKRGMGALEFEPIQHATAETAERINIDQLVRVAEEILGKRTDFTTSIQDDVKKGLEDIIRVGTSAGGARAKAIIAYNEKNGEVRSGQVTAPKGFEHWLIKFDGVDSSELKDPKGYGRIEYAYYKMIVDCGIEMSESKLLEENGRAHFMTKRFDRIAGKEKLHVQSLCAMSHFDFSKVGAYAYEQVFQTIRSLRLSASASQQLYKRMVFNVVARNLDDHTKNFSFIMDKTGTWNLAPAFDVTWSYNPSNKWIQRHNLSMNGKTDNITRDDLLKVGKEMGVKKTKAIIDEVISVVKKWPSYAEETGVKSAQLEHIGSTHLTHL
ncbi:MAG: type II toxin-antitoxin system HipA family toxin [Bacteroidetes bacterium]|nr:type II toxin-antitoxin system HipA family toxin [Bacteroidota bacterium]